MGVCEAAILMIVATCPALLVSFADHPFEPHKAAWLWTMTAAAGAAALLSGRTVVERWRGMASWSRAIIIAAGALATAMLASTLISAAPALSWWGSSLRRMGALTECCVLALLVLVIFIGNRRQVIDRLATALLAGSVGPTVYSLAQALGLDPLNPAEPSARAGSTLGNPLFLGGFLAVVLPIAVGVALRRTEDRKTHQSADKRAIACWVLVSAQAAALVAIRALGPTLALGAAAAVWGCGALAMSGRRKIAMAASVAVTISVIAAGPIAVRRIPTSVPGSTLAVRGILWRAAASGIVAGRRVILGGGSESTTALLTTYSGPDLRTLEGPDTAPDRAHSETLETLAAFGIVGLVLRLIILAAVFGAALAALGFVDRRNWMSFTGFTVAALVAWFAGLPIVGHGLWALALAVPLAMATLIAAWFAWSLRVKTPASVSNSWVVVGASAGLLAHTFEIGVGIETVSAALAAAIAAGIVVARSDTSGPEPVDAPLTERAVRAQSWALACTAGWSAAVMTIGLSGSAPGLSTWIIGAATWLLATALVGTEASGVAVSAIAWIVPVVVWLLWRDVPPDSTAIAFAHATATRLPHLYALGGACFVAVAALLARTTWRSRAQVTAILAAVVCGAVAAAWSLRLTQADVLQSAARQCAARNDLECAVALYDEASTGDQTNGDAFGQLASALMRQSEATADAASRGALFVRAEQALAEARGIDPYEYHMLRNTAALHRRWARASAPGERAPHLEEADRWYVMATALAPGAGLLWAEWGNLDLERGRIDPGLLKLDRAAQAGLASQVSAVCDLLLRLSGLDVGRPGVMRQAAEDFRVRHYLALAALYTRRADFDEHTQR